MSDRLSLLWVMLWITGMRLSRDLIRWREVCLWAID